MSKEVKEPPSHAARQDSSNPQVGPSSGIGVTPTVNGSEQGLPQYSIRPVQIAKINSEDFRKKSANLRKLWLSNRQQFGPSDSRTIRSLFELCLSWKDLNVLRDSIRAEAPCVMTWTIKAHNADFLTFLLQQKIDPDQVDEAETTPLMYATEMNHAQEVKLLLNGGANVLWPEGSVTPLHVAADKNHSTILEYLLEAGMQVDALNHTGNPALFYACNHGHTDIVRILLRNGVRPDHTGPSKIIPLHCAVSRGHQEIVELLLDAGANIHARNLNLTPVLVAINYEHGKVLESLLSRGAEANPSINEDFALHFAARKGFRSIITILLEAGAPVDSANEGGHTVLAIAAARGIDDIVDRLLSRGASVNAKSKYGRTPLHEAAWSGHSIVIKQLLRAGAEVTAGTVYGFTPLHYAAEKGHCEAVNLLLDHHADPNVTSASTTVLNLAVKAKNLEIVKRLVHDWNVDVNLQAARGWSPLHMAASHSSLAMVDYLLDHGARPEIADYQGHTALLMATSVGQIDVVERLTSYEVVDINRQSMHGLAPLHIAAFKGHLDIVKFFLSKGANTNALALGNSTPLSLATWNLEAEVASLLLPLTQDPFLLDCFGRNSFDWASRDDSLLARLRTDPQSASYIPTTPAVRRSHILQMTRTLIDGLLHNRKANDMRFTVLARNLLSLHDVTEAEHAYQLEMCDHIQGPLPYCVKCDMCEKFITGTVHVCMECAEQDLCDECMGKYKAKTGEVKSCSGHRYHTIANRHWEGMYSVDLTVKNTRGMSVDEWLRHVKVAYGGKLGM